MARFQHFRHGLLGHIQKAEHDLERALADESAAEKELREATEDLESAEQSPQGGPHPHDVTFRIAVNGVAEAWHHKKISYEEVVKLAFPDGPTGGEVRYSVSWTKPDGQEGSLRPGHSVDVVDRMIFDVRNTDKS